MVGAGDGHLKLEAETSPLGTRMVLQLLLHFCSSCPWNVVGLVLVGRMMLITPSTPSNVLSVCLSVLSAIAGSVWLVGHHMSATYNAKVGTAIVEAQATVSTT